MKEKERLVRLLNYTIKLQFKHQLKKVNCILNFLIKNFFSLRDPMRKSKNKLLTRRKYLENMYLIVTVSYANLTRLPSWGFPEGSTVVKNPSANAGDARNEGSVPGSGISPAVGNGNPLQYSWLENSMDRGAWWATVHGVAKSQTWLSNWEHECVHAHTHTHNT